MGKINITQMRIETNRCTCSQPQPFQITDSYNSIGCDVCYEIISYDKPEKKKFFKIKHLQPTIADFVDVLNKIRPDVSMLTCMLINIFLC